MTQTAAGRDLPRFLTELAPTRGLRRLTPFSRLPATPHFAYVWDAAAERAATRAVVFDEPSDVAPERPLDQTYADVAGLVDELTGWLHAAGVEPWDRVAIMKRNHADVALLACAAARLGAIPVTIAWTHPPQVAKTLLDRLERPVLITDRARLASCELDEDAVAALTKRTISVDSVEGRTDVLELADVRGAARQPPRPRAMHEPMVVTHTSGTTGVPKLVLHSAETIHALTHVESDRWPFLRLREEDVYLFCDPYFHARSTTGMLALATVPPKLVLMSDPEPDRARRLLAEHVPTKVETVPNAFLYWEPLADDPRRLFRNVHLFMNTFDAIHTRTIRKLLNASERRFPVWIQTWGQSEAGPVAARPFTRFSVRHVGRRPPVTRIVGWPLPYYAKVRAVDPATGARVRRGEVGLIEVSQPGRCLTYVGEPDRHALKRNGDWWNTGDLGIVKRNGAVRLVDREVDRIPGASAIELEDILLDRLPQTTEVVVLALPDAPPVPVLSTSGDEPIPPGEWARATADLPRMADPVQVGWDEIPRTATWKVQRFALRERVLPGSRPVGTGRWT